MLGTNPHKNEKEHIPANSCGLAIKAGTFYDTNQNQNQKQKKLYCQVQFYTYEEFVVVMLVHASNNYQVKI